MLLQSTSSLTQSYDIKERVDPFASAYYTSFLMLLNLGNPHMLLNLTTLLQQPPPLLAEQSCRHLAGHAWRVARLGLSEVRENSTACHRSKVRLRAEPTRPVTCKDQRLVCIGP